jgi:hypothetical protein
VPAAGSFIAALAGDMFCGSASAIICPIPIQYLLHPAMTILSPAWQQDGRTGMNRSSDRAGNFSQN